MKNLHLEHLKEEEKEKILEAINFAKEKLAKEEFEKNIEITKTLSLTKLSAETLIASIFYKQEKLTKELETFLDKEIIEIIKGQKTLKEIKKKSKFSKTNPLRQIILTTIKDPRIIFVKLAAKLNNLKRIEHSTDFKKDEKLRIANEVLEIYAPIASRLGLEQIKKDLQDISLKIINPKKYKEIQKYLKDSQEKRQEYIKKIIEKITLLLENKIKLIKIKGREKQIFSIYEKITKRKVPLNKQRDHFGIRIITDSTESCYNALNIIKTNYEEIPGTFKDYIKNPKKNGYQSLHTSLKIEDSKMLEVQIRTKEMDEIAEEGVAAHFLYKGLKSNLRFEKKTGWLKEILNLEEKNSLKDLKLNLFEDKIYCYTPKGEAHSLPKESSVLDFAYQIHGEIGSKAIAGLINKKFVPLKTKIKNGDIIEIITNKFQRPRRSWMKFIVTEKAKKLISRDVKRFEKIPVAKTYLKEKEDENKIEKIIEIPEFKNHEPSFAQCCKPIPPQDIVGILKSHKKILVHKTDCKRISESQKHSCFVEWKSDFQKQIKIQIVGIERPGILADLLNTIVRQKIKVTEANAKMIENDLAQCSFLMEIKTIEELQDIIERLKKIKGIKKIWLD